MLQVIRTEQVYCVKFVHQNNQNNNTHDFNNNKNSTKKKKKTMAISICVSLRQQRQQQQQQQQLLLQMHLPLLLFVAVWLLASSLVLFPVVIVSFTPQQQQQQQLNIPSWTISSSCINIRRRRRRRRRRVFATFDDADRRKSGRISLPAATPTTISAVTASDYDGGHDSITSSISSNIGDNSCASDDTNKANNNNSNTSSSSSSSSKLSSSFYDLGVGKHLPKQHQQQQQRSEANTTMTIIANSTDTDATTPPPPPSSSSSTLQQQQQQRGIHWMAPEGVKKPATSTKRTSVTTIKQQQHHSTATTITTNNNNNNNGSSSSRLNVIVPNTQSYKKSRRMVARDNEGQLLRGALWDEQHYKSSPSRSSSSTGTGTTTGSTAGAMNSNTNPLLEQQQQQQLIQKINGAAAQQQQQQQHQQHDPSQPRQQQESTAIRNNNNNNYNSNKIPPYPKAFYPDIDLSIPDSVYDIDNNIDLVWDLLRYEAYQNQIEQQYEPLLVSYLHSTILNHDTLESSLAFLLANRLQSPAMMISTQLQSLIYNTLQESPTFRRMLRADIMAVRDRDPACHTLPDVFLYFKGFHALQSYRTAHVLWNSNRQLLAQYLHSQVSQIFQIDIHPNATIGTGIMLDHGTGIVIGETATVGHNCSILHHVTLGGSGKKGVIRHPNVGNGVLVGAGATLLGPITIGDGCQIGAGTLVIADIPPHSVAVGVPARIIGNFVDVTEQPSIGMDQIMEHTNFKAISFDSATFESDGI